MSDDLDFMPAGPADGKDEDAESKSASKSKSKSKSKGGPNPSDEPGERAELPTWNRARRKRKANEKAGAADDAFQRGVRKAGRQVIDTPKLVIGAIVIVTAAIAGGVAIYNKTQAADAAASRTLQTATEAVVRGEILPMDQREGLEELIARSPYPIFATAEERDAYIAEAISSAKGSDNEAVATNALIVDAARSVRTGDFEAAVTGYDAFLSAADEDHPLRFLALEGKGIALEASGELEAALAVFESIAPEPADFYRHMALYHRGRVLEGLERKDEAVAIYQQFFEEFPVSTETMATPLVRDRLEEVAPDVAAGLAPPPAPPGSPMQLPLQMQ